jgi:3-oxoacyl-[acyl-carrier-protein] synthase-3
MLPKRIPMPSSMYARITGTGSYLPVERLSNIDLEKRLDTQDEWIYSRTGIRARHIVASHQKTSDLAYEASILALKSAGLQGQDLDLIIVATTTPDVIFPSTACILQERLGAAPCPAFDLQAVCAGFMYALVTGQQFITSGQAQHVLVVGAEAMSRLLDWNDRRTCVLFGDGAGAVVLSAASEPGIIHTKLLADGQYARILNTPACLNHGQLNGHPYLYMDGPAVFKFAVKALADTATQILTEANFPLNRLDWLVPHQANARIIESTAKHLGLTMERVILTLEQQGNTSAASIPLALDKGVRDGRIQKGHHLLLEGIGGGLAWGGALLRF